MVWGFVPQTPEKSLKVPLCGTFNDFSGVLKSAKRCSCHEIQTRRVALRRGATLRVWISHMGVDRVLTLVKLDRLEKFELLDHRA
jgi:hypothetical protein